MVRRVSENSRSSLGRRVGAGRPRGATGTARALTLIERFFLAAGIVLFLAIVAHIGVGAVLENLRLIGPGVLIIVGQEVVATVANTWGWRQAFPSPRPAIPFRRLFTARVAGDGINCVTPTATIGGEFVRARMIEDLADPTVVWASVAVAKLTQTVAQAVFVVSGLLFVAIHTSLPAAVRHGLLTIVPLFLAGVIAAVVLQRRGMFTTITTLLRRLRLPVPPRTGGRLRRLDDEIRRVYDAPLTFVCSSGFFLLGWLWGVVEIYLILYFLGVGASWQRALSIEALSVAVDGLFFFVPSKAGTQEGGKVLIFVLLGLDPGKGLTLGIVRRIRELSWSALGLALLSHGQFRSSGSGLSQQAERPAS